MEWSNNLESLLSVLESVQGGVRGLVMDRDTAAGPVGPQLWGGVSHGPGGDAFPRSLLFGRIGNLKAKL